MKKSNSNTKFIIIVFGFIILIGILVYFLLLENKKEIEFTITDTKINLKIGEIKKINYQINDDNINIVWSSDNSNIASIDENGVIKAIDYGNAIITGKVVSEDSEIINKCIVNTYSGDMNISLQEIIVDEGELLMMPNSEFIIPFTIVPSNSYITSLEYNITDSNVIEIKDGKIVSKNVGTATLSINVNNSYQKEIMVSVEEDAKENKIIKRIEKVSIDEEDLILKPGDTKELSYTIKPSNAYVKDIKWESSNPDVVSVIDGEIKALKDGESVIKLIVNSNMESTINVKVIVLPSGIKIDYYPKTVIKVGEKTTITSHVLPDNASDKNINYKSSNPSVATISNGVITGVNAGNAVITMSTSNNKTATININVLPSKGIINGTGNLWGYKSLNEKTMVRADTNFFAKLAQSGRGILQGNVFTYQTGDTKYTYNIDSSNLVANNYNIKVRIYYPQVNDLSSLNIFTYMGGDGEKNFGGYFNQIENNKTLIKSAGIVILVAEGNNTKFDQYAANYATNFVQSIINQKSSAKRSIAGFSTGGTKVMGAANLYNYDRIIVFSSYYNWATIANNIKNKEIIFYVPSKDHLYSQAKTTLNDMKSSGYTNVTIVTNSTDLANAFGNTFLVINPGNLMLTGHLSDNVNRAGLFSYANE